MNSHPTPEQSRALDLIRRADRFVLVGHVRPDGDVLGSQGGLWSVLRALGKEVRIVNPDPPAPQFGFLAAEVPFGSYEGAALPEHDVTVMLDFADRSRTGPLEAAIAASGSTTLVIDHHQPPAQPWWDEAFVDSGAAATGILVLRLARALGVEPDALAATSLFTSIATDTGWFQHSNTDAEALTAVAELVVLGADPHAVHRALFKRRSPEHPRAVGRLLAGVRYLAGGRIAYLEQAGAGDVDPDVGDAALDLVREVDCVEIALLLRQDGDRRFKLSARSEGDVDVDHLAGSFGGGGHRKAAGAELTGPLDEARARLLAAAVGLLEGPAVGRAGGGAGGDRR